MKWILIIIGLYGQTSAEFDTKIACETAGAAMQANSHRIQIAWGCFPEGRTGGPYGNEKNL